MKRHTPILEVRLPSRYAEAASQDLVDAGAVAVEERDASTLEAEQEGMECLIAGFACESDRSNARRFIEAAPYYPVDLADIDEVPGDWQTRWREFFKPVILDRLQIVTPWMALPRPDRIPIVIDPGQAFGTGGHETTRLVLSMLESRAAQGGLPSRVLDIGTGSGILAIAAAKLGAEEVLGVDIETESIEAFEENARQNGVSDRLTCRLGLASVIAGEWPLVLANLQLEVFLTGAIDIQARVAPGGEILLSGLLDEQVDACIGLFASFKVAEQRREGEWAALALIRLP